MMDFKPKRYFFLFLLIISAILYNSCKDDQEIVPYTPFTLNIDLGIRNNLKVSGYSDKFPEYGYSGVIVFCEFYDSYSPSASIYHAYDAACTFEVRDTCSLVAEDNGVIATCPCCGSKFSLFDGYPLSGDATKPLREYNTYFYDETLRVKN